MTPPSKEPKDLDSQVRSFLLLVPFELLGARPMFMVAGGAVEEDQAVGYLLCGLGQAAWPSRASFLTSAMVIMAVPITWGWCEH